jgi:hypothetical protein
MAGQREQRGGVRNSIFTHFDDVVGSTLCANNGVGHLDSLIPPYLVPTSSLKVYSQAPKLRHDLSTKCNLQVRGSTRSCHGSCRGSLPSSKWIKRLEFRLGNIFKENCNKYNVETPIDFWIVQIHW